jgi:hypothetical protein
VALADGEDFRCAGSERAGKDGVRIGDCEHHSDGSTFQGLWTEVAVLRRFVGQPKFGSVDGKSGYHRTVGHVEKVDSLALKADL